MYVRCARRVASRRKFRRALWCSPYADINLAPLDTVADAAAERAELQTAQKDVAKSLATVETELAAARKAGRTKEVELLLYTRAQLHQQKARLDGQKEQQMTLEVVKARKVPPPSDGAPSCFTVHCLQRGEAHAFACSCQSTTRGRLRPFTPPHWQRSACARHGNSGASLAVLLAVAFTLAGNICGPTT